VPIIQHAVWLYLRFTLSYRGGRSKPQIGDARPERGRAQNSEDPKRRCRMRCLSLHAGTLGPLPEPTLPPGGMNRVLRSICVATSGNHDRLDLVLNGFANRVGVADGPTAEPFAGAGPVVRIRLPPPASQLPTSVRWSSSVPPGGLGQRYGQVTAWLAENCGAEGWAVRPSGTRGILNDAI
jgi:hypothetical protein